jgi:uncharacterized protein YbjT (DUF2867 family)
VRTILVTGATGVLGRRVVRELTRRGHEIRFGSRTPRVESQVKLDLATGDGVAAAVDGVDAVVHCASDSKHHTLVDVAGTDRLSRAARHVHIVYPGIVGSDIIPCGYYRSKIAAETTVLAHPGGGTVLRSTQFHQLIWGVLTRKAGRPAILVDRSTRFQVLDPDTVAVGLVDAVEAGPQGRVPDIGGRFAYEAADLARSFKTATGVHKPIVALNRRGLVGASLRAGANLTPNRDETGESWNDFIDRQRRHSG